MSATDRGRWWIHVSRPCGPWCAARRTPSAIAHGPPLGASVARMSSSICGPRAGIWPRHDAARSSRGQRRRRVSGIVNDQEYARGPPVAGHGLRGGQARRSAVQGASPYRLGDLRRIDYTSLALPPCPHPPLLGASGVRPGGRAAGPNPRRALGATRGLRRGPGGRFDIGRSAAFRSANRGDCADRPGPLLAREVHDAPEVIVYRVPPRAPFRSRLSARSGRVASGREAPRVAHASR